MMAVSRIMSRDLIKIDKDRNLEDAINLMEKNNISRLLVTEDDKIIGIITEEDIANRLATGRERKLKTGHIHVSSAMSKELVVVERNEDIRVAARIMLENGFSSLPVTGDNEIIGLVTKTDLIKILRNSDAEVLRFYTRNPIIVNPNDSLVFARKLMLENNIHRLLVTNEGLLVGILTERDIASGLRIFRRALDKYEHPDIHKLKVHNVMTPEPITTTPRKPISEVVNLMLNEGVSGIPVIARDSGIITKTDLIRGIANGELP
ncbi:MAG TPA: CBS domain-containing protein [Candidatus Altiarchaeales archaeon]|nr:CBS domain-containing protein [Candidatus Altiarchaeales archaeon]HEX55473.1 CBS domain-containing protein [Candidatus Altiarchaeales archaeon]